MEGLGCFVVFALMIALVISLIIVGFIMTDWHNYSRWFRPMTRAIANRMPAVFICNLGVHRGVWEYDQPDACVQTLRCDLCGEVKQREAHGPFHVWEYFRLNDCNQSQRCGRCGTYIGSRTNHESWESMSFFSNKEQCTRCGEEHQKRQ